MTRLPDECVDLTITSPPYDQLRNYNGFAFDFPAIASQLFRITKPGGVVVWVVNDAVINGSETGTSFRQALGFVDAGFRLHDTMIYHKQNPVPITSNRYQPAFEFMFVISKGTPNTFNALREQSRYAGHWKGQRRTHRKKASGELETFWGVDRTVEPTKVHHNVFTYRVGWKHTAPDDRWTQHPAVFPLQLAKDHVSTWSNPGNLVFDAMCGSGQTLIAADVLGRHWLGMDCSAEYCELARERLAWFRPPPTRN
jgi:DNA modification methylase